MLIGTTLLSSPTPLFYGTGAGLGNQIDGTPLGSGEPSLNAINHTRYFTGRSDNFDPEKLSTDPNDARLDPESIRVSNDGKMIFVSDCSPSLQGSDSTHTSIELPQFGQVWLPTGGPTCPNCSPLNPQIPL